VYANNGGFYADIHIIGIQVYQDSLDNARQYWVYSIYSRYDINTLTLC